jgi:hypothetical protein
MTRSHFKKRNLFKDQGGPEFQPAGILKYVEDLKEGANTEFGPKDYFEMACRLLSAPVLTMECRVLFSQVTQDPDTTPVGRCCPKTTANENVRTDDMLPPAENRGKQHASRPG